MTLEQLRTFLWVAKLNGVRRAADRLNLSQPAVSTRLATLESQLGKALFERQPGGLVLTREGQSLLTYAEQMLFVEEEIRRQVADPTGMSGLFRLGASETIAQSWLPAFIKEFSVTFPNVRLDLTVDISQNLRAMVLQRQVDLAFLMGPVSEFSVENVPLPDFDLHWFKAAGSGPVDLMTIPVISYALKTRPHRELTEMLSRRFGPGVRIYSSASLSASLRMIAEGVAVGPYPEVIAKPALAAGRIEAFDPGLPCNPLTFTASYLTEPRSHLAETGAELARTIAVAWSVDGGT